MMIDLLSIAACLAVATGHEIRIEHYRAVAAALHYAAKQRSNPRRV